MIRYPYQDRLLAPSRLEIAYDTLNSKDHNAFEVSTSGQMHRSLLKRRNHTLMFHLPPWTSSVMESCDPATPTHFARYLNT